MSDALPPDPSTSPIPSPAGMRHFFTGPFIKTDLLVIWLEKHGIRAIAESVNPNDDENDLGRDVHVHVPVADFDRAFQLFFAERQDEL